MRSLYSLSAFALCSTFATFAIANPIVVGIDGTIASAFPDLPSVIRRSDGTYREFTGLTFPYSTPRGARDVIRLQYEHEGAVPTLVDAPQWFKTGEGRGLRDGVQVVAIRSAAFVVVSEDGSEIESGLSLTDLEKKEISFFFQASSGGTMSVVFEDEERSLIIHDDCETVRKRMQYVDLLDVHLSAFRRVRRERRAARGPSSPNTIVLELLYVPDACVSSSFLNIAEIGGERMILGSKHTNLGRDTRAPAMFRMIGRALGAVGDYRTLGIDDGPYVEWDFTLGHKYAFGWIAPQSLVRVDGCGVNRNGKAGPDEYEGTAVSLRPINLDAEPDDFQVRDGRSTFGLVLRDGRPEPFETWIEARANAANLEYIVERWIRTEYGVVRNESFVLSRPDSIAHVGDCVIRPTNEGSVSVARETFHTVYGDAPIRGPCVFTEMTRCIRAARIVTCESFEGCRWSERGYCTPTDCA